jgi:hypothetical protein
MLPEYDLKARIDLGRLGLLIDMVFVLILRALGIRNFRASVRRALGRDTWDTQSWLFS